ncbi:MAG: Jag N-terminal domain-containing protein [Peptoniphilaceae bacterium]|nr:Jag N-terminal domain-containing protein [Peptoniphilaceae bacterium]MDY6018905.1 RNA-binding cell elongation regulator Jag/EloR [Anaerococcus sp.]
MKKTIIKSARTKDQAIEEALRQINKIIDEVEIEVLEEESNGFLGLIGQKDAVIKITYDDDINEDLEEIKEDLENESLFDELEILNDQTYQEDVLDDDNLLKDQAKEKEEVFENQSDLYYKQEEDENDLDENQSEEDRQKNNIERYYRAKEFFKEILEAMHFENVKVIGNLEGNIIKLEAKIDERDTGIAIGKGGKTIDAIELIIRKSLKAKANDLKVNIDINNYKKRRDDKIIEQADYAARRVAKTRKKWNLKYMNSYERRLAHEQIAKYEGLTSYSEGQEPNRYVVVDIK